MNELFLPILSAVILVSIVIAILCIKQKYTDKKACFFVDLFTVTAAGASLVISSTVLTQTFKITQNFHKQSSSVRTTAPASGSVSELSAEIRLQCTDLGDGYMECLTEPVNINLR